MINFVHTNDVLTTLNVGKNPSIKSWLISMHVTNYFINDDFTIDVNGNVDLKNKNLCVFPDNIQFNKVTGSFDCSYNQLINLRGCPKIIGDNFYCDHNNLTDLLNSPLEVGDYYFCNNNQLFSLKGLTKKFKSIGCYDNLLKTLEGLPETILGNLLCQNNLLESLESLPKYVKKDLHINFLNNKYSIKDIMNVCYVSENINIL